MVPSRPPSWYSRAASSHRVTRELRGYIRDADTANYGPYPLQPTIEAILHADPEYNTRGVDVVACSLTFEHLLRLMFTRHAQSFRILVQGIGKTVFFLPREGELNGLVPDLKGFQRSFPDWYTGWGEDVRNSGSHHRVLEYGFGGLRCVVRHEADGYLMEMAQEMEEECGCENKAVGEQFTTFSRYDVDGRERILIVDGGSDIQQQAIFDMEARSVLNYEHDGVDAADDQKMARLWVRQIHHALIGFHEGNVFKNVRVTNMREDIRAWQRNKMDAIGGLSAILK